MPTTFTVSLRLLIILCCFQLVPRQIKADIDGANFAKDNENSGILINVNHIIDFLQSIKKSQGEMFDRIESLTKSVESTDREEQRSRMKLSRKLSTLEIRITELEGSLPSQVEEAVKHQVKNTEFIPITTQPPPPTVTQKPIESLINQPENLQKLSLAPPPPALSFSQFPLNQRSSRDISYFEPPFRDPNHRPNYLRNPERSVSDRQGYLSIQLLEESRQKMKLLNETLEILKYKISSVENKVQNINQTGFSNINAGMNGVVFKPESELEEKLTSNEKQVTALRKKQSEMQRAIDTVLIHFSTIVNGLESADKKIEETQQNFTAQLQQLALHNNNNNNRNVELLSEDDEQLPPLNGNFPLGTLKTFIPPEASPLVQQQHHDQVNAATEPVQKISERNEEFSKEYSSVIRVIGNLTHEVESQKYQIIQLSTELAKVNVSHLLLLRTIDEETLKRTIRPKDCSEIRLFRNNGTSGKYTIFPTNNEQPLEVFCDLETDGGGWTLVQRRGHPLNRGEVRPNFFRNWTEYENGFGSIHQDFWLGLSNIAALSKLGDQELRIEMTKWNGENAFASYKHFHVADGRNLYKLQISGYSGNAGDSLSRHNGMFFSTMDKDNDEDPQRNCAQMWRGAWWYYGCHESNLNGLYAENRGNEEDYGSSDFGTGIIWYNWTGNYYSLKNVEIKIRNTFVVRNAN